MDGDSPRAEAAENASGGASPGEMADIGTARRLLASQRGEPQSVAEEVASGRIIRIARAIPSTRDAQENQRPRLRVSCYERF
jgi:hypothetical protein